MAKILTSDEVMDTLDIIPDADAYDCSVAQTEAMEAVRASHKALRDLLRRVVAQQCVKVYEDDSSDGEIVPVLDAIEDAIRAEVEAAVEGGR